MNVKHPNYSLDVESHIRRNASAAGFLAGLFILFGFCGVFGPPSGDGLFFYGDSLFQLTLRLGGIALAVVAVWSSIGTPAALAADAVTSMAIGIGLMTGAVLMVIGDGSILTNLLYFVCGIIFMTSGLRLWSEYSSLPREKKIQVEEVEIPDDLAGSEHAAIDGAIADAARAQQTPSASSPEDSDLITFDRPARARHARPSSVIAQDDTIRLDKLDPPKSPPPDGYLADLARKKPPK